MALKRSLRRGAADLIGLGDVGTAGDVRGAALERGELDGAGLRVQMARDEVGEVARRAGQALVAEGVDGVHVVRQLADVAAVGQANALGNRHDDGGIALLQRLDLGDELLGVKRHLGQADEVDALAVLALRQRRGRGQPAGVAAHDLDDGDVLRAVNRRVADELLHDDADVLGGGAVARGMVGAHQVVVDRLGHADEADVAADLLGIVAQLADRVHAVVAADIEEVSDIHAVEDREQVFIDLGMLEIAGQLVAAASQIGGRAALEQLDLKRGAQRRTQIDHTALEQALDAVQHAVDMLRTAHLAGLQHACQARVNDTGRAAGLTDDSITSHKDSSNFSCCFVYIIA